MLGRERREERRDERQDDRGPGGGGDNRYQMVQKMVSIGDDFWIENGRGAGRRGGRLLLDLSRLSTTKGITFSPVRGCHVVQPRAGVRLLSPEVS